MNRSMATVTAMSLIFRLWVREGDHRVRGGVGNAGDGVTAHGMAWLSIKGDQAMGVLHPSLVHSAHTEAPTTRMDVGGALLPQQTHICFLGGGCPGDPSWLKWMGGMPGACLGPGFKYPGPGGGHARNQTPPDQRQWTRQRSGIFFHFPSEWSLFKGS